MLHAESTVKNNKLLSEKYFKNKTDGIFYVTLCLQTEGKFLTEDNINRHVESMGTSGKELGPSGDMELENIMDMPDHGRDKGISSQVLLLGGPGTGKTTISQTLSYRWGIRELWDEKYDFVFHLTCRKLKEDCSESKETSILKLLMKHHRTESKNNIPTQNITNLEEELYQHIKSYGDRVLVIIDGLDELEGWNEVVKKQEEVVKKYKKWIKKLKEFIRQQDNLNRIQNELAEKEVVRKKEELDKRQEEVVYEQQELGKIQKELAEKRKELDEELEKVAKERKVNKQKELDEKNEDINNLRQEVNARHLEVEEGQKEVNDRELELVDKPMEMIQKLKDMINKQKKLDERRNELDKNQKELNENKNEITNYGKPTIQTKHPVPELIFNLAFGLIEEKVEVLLTSRPIESITEAEFLKVLYALGFNEDAIDECSFAMCNMKESEHVGKQKEGTEKKNEVDEKQREEAEIQNEDAGKQNEKDGKQNEETGKQGEETGKQDEEAEKQNEETGKQDEEAEKQTEEAGKQNKMVVNKHAELMKRIREERPALYYLCVVPLNCVLLWSRLLEDKDSIKSLTDLSLSTVMACVRSREENQGNDQYNFTPAEVKLLRSMARLACKCFLSGQLIFTNKDIKQDFNVEDSCVNNLMEIHGSSEKQSDNSSNSNPDNIQASFIHLTIQEFLAAVHVCLTWNPEEVSKVATVDPDSRRMDNVQLYTAGLLGDTNNGHKFLQALDERSGDKEQLYQKQANEYVTSMNPPGEEMSSLTQLQMIRCAHEGRMTKMVEEVAKAVLEVTNKDPVTGRTIDEVNMLDLSYTDGGLLPHHLVSIQYFVQESGQVEGLW